MIKQDLLSFLGSENNPLSYNFIQHICSSLSLNLTIKKPDPVWRLQLVVVVAVVVVS